MTIEKHVILFQRMLIILVLALFALLIKRNNPDSDAYFLAATGRYILENRQIPLINPFCFHDGLRIIIQQWIPAIINYWIFVTFGEEGTVWYALIFFYFQMFLCYRYASFFSENRSARWVSMLISGVFLMFFANSRPTSISFCMIMLELFVLECYRRSPIGNRRLCWLPIISLIEVNCHAALWPALFIMMLPYVFFEKVPKKARWRTDMSNWFQAKKKYLIAMLAMFLSGFLNPNGIRGMLYLAYSYGEIGNQISELQSPRFLSFWGIIITLCIMVFAWYLAENKNHLDMKIVYMAAGTLLLAMMHLRNFWYLTFGMMPILLSGISEVVSEKGSVLFSKKGYICAEILTILIAGTGFSLAWSNTEMTMADSETTPILAADYLDGLDQFEITLFTGFNNGAYMEWRGYQVYIDARPELYEKKINGVEDLYEEFLSTRRNGMDYQFFLEKYGFTHLIVGETETFYTYLECSEDYIKVIEGKGYGLFERIGWSDERS